MSKILIFAGTSEGRSLAEALSKQNISSIVSVATEYGREVMPDLPGVEQIMGRLDVAQMTDLIGREGIETVVDATHPFAVEVSANIREACAASNARYIRLRRNTASGILAEGSLTWFSDSSQCADALKNTEGNILLTTGSKELGIYCADESVRSRIFARVLPGIESIELCNKAGLSGKQIIAMQGPFCQEMNEALIKQFDIKIMVTKETGKAGGLDEKLTAAEKCQIKTFVIGAPLEEDGLSLEAVLKELGVSQKVKITLAGIGMGSEDFLTVAAKKAIDEADYILGARRMIESYRAKIEKKDVYLAKDIIPYISDKTGNVVVLFSGDSGFYSGCKKLKDQLSEAGFTDVTILPGISSVSYLSAATGIPWSGAEVFSVHGVGTPKDWSGKLYEKVSHSDRTFLLLSGIKDVNAIGKLLLGKENYRIVLASNLSYGDEKIEELTPEQCAEKKEESLYCCVILNSDPKKAVMTNSHRDDEFIRAKVPMTKEEIRTVSISKLGLTQDSVVWDVGSGTGSIAVEIAGYSSEIKVYAVEFKEEATELIKQNADKFDLVNVDIIKGKAPEALVDLPAPDCVFIGGSSGELEEILSLIYEKNHNARVVINAVSMETIAQVTNLIPTLNAYNFETVSMSVSRTKTLGRYNLLQAENPVMIFSFTFR